MEFRASHSPGVWICARMQNRLTREYNSVTWRKPPGNVERTFGGKLDDIIITLYALVQSRYMDIDYLNQWTVSVERMLPGNRHWLHGFEYCQHIDCAEIALEQELGNWQDDTKFIRLHSLELMLPQLINR